MPFKLSVFPPTNKNSSLDFRVWKRCVFQTKVISGISCLQNIIQISLQKYLTYLYVFWVEGVWSACSQSFQTLLSHSNVNVQCNFIDWLLKYNFEARGMNVNQLITFSKSAILEYGCNMHWAGGVTPIFFKKKKNVLHSDFPIPPPSPLNFTIKHVLWTRHERRSSYTQTWRIKSLAKSQ